MLVQEIPQSPSREAPLEGLFLLREGEGARTRKLARKQLAQSSTWIRVEPRELTSSNTVIWFVSRWQWVSLVSHSLALASCPWHHGFVTIGKKKRPRDPNQLAKWTVHQSTSETPPGPLAVPPVPPSDLSAYMAAMGRKGGQIGGRRRLITMSKAARSKVAAKAAKARWSKPKH